MIFSWLVFAVLASAAVLFSVWIYFRWELPIPGRNILVVTRSLILVIVSLLIWDPRITGDRAGYLARTDHWVLLDGSASMSAGIDSSDVAWTSALSRAQELATEGMQVLMFGSSNVVVHRDSLQNLEPTESNTSLLAPALASVAEYGAQRVTILSDLRLDDPVEANLTAQRLSLNVESEIGENSTRNAGIYSFELPTRIESDGALIARVEVFSEGIENTDTIRIHILEEDRVVASTYMLPADLGSLATTSVSIPYPSSSGWVRYRLLLELEGDKFPADDTKSIFLEIGSEDNDLVMISFQPDWEPRFLLPVLSQVTGLDASGYLSIGNGSYLQLGAGIDAGRSSDDIDVHKVASSADFLVLHGVDGDSSEWVRRIINESNRVLLFSNDSIGVSSTGMHVGIPLSGEWYLVPELPSSPLASNLAGADLRSLPPLSNILPIVQSDSVSKIIPIHLQFQGSGPKEAAFALIEDKGKRSVVVLASGFWRWAFRGGNDRQVYRRLWAGIAGWLLSSTPVEGNPRVSPTIRVGKVGEDMIWRASGLIGDSIVFEMLSGDSVVMDTTVMVNNVGEARTRWLASGEYTYNVKQVDNSENIGNGRLEFEGHSLEMFRRPTEIISDFTNVSKWPQMKNKQPRRPLHSNPFPYLLIILLLSMEWIGRRRWGLR